MFTQPVSSHLCKYEKNDYIMIIIFILFCWIIRLSPLHTVTSTFSLHSHTNTHLFPQYEHKQTHIYTRSHKHAHTHRYKMGEVFDDIFGHVIRQFSTIKHNKQMHVSITLCICRNKIFFLFLHYINILWRLQSSDGIIDMHVLSSPFPLMVSSRYGGFQQNILCWFISRLLTLKV